MTYSKHWFSTPENAGGSASIGRSDGSDWIHFESGPTEAQGEVLVQALNLLDLSGKTPDELARSLADAQAEIARLRGALEVLETDAHFIFNNPPGETSQDVRDVIEWFAGSIRVALEQAK